MRLGAQPFFFFSANEFYLHENEKWFPYQRMSPYPSFETEATGELGNGLLFLIDDIPSWPTVNLETRCLRKTRRILLSHRARLEDRSFLLWKITVDCFLRFSLNLNLADYINQEIRWLRRGGFPGKHITTSAWPLKLIYKSLIGTTKAAVSTVYISYPSGCVQDRSPQGKNNTIKYRL